MTVHSKNDLAEYTEQDMENSRLERHVRARHPALYSDWGGGYGALRKAHDGEPDHKENRPRRRAAKKTATTR
jgi:hypothetical protein